MKVISTDNASKALGPYSQAVFAWDTFYLSGQIAINFETGSLVDTNIDEETKQIMRNLFAVLSAAGLTFDNVVKTTIFATDIVYFGAVNKIYAECFSGHLPARSLVQVEALPNGAWVEIEMVAVR
ncbi:MAG: Rid family detoxifying hydrolase [Phascolarctobacterium sp.]|nr:Rid family detoxifying hydrolase [Phascolarctobacterium sp.]